MQPAEEPTDNFKSYVDTDRSHRSPSRSSLGSKHSHREERTFRGNEDFIHDGRSGDRERHAGGDERPGWTDGDLGGPDWGRDRPGGPPHRGGGPPPHQAAPLSPMEASTPPWERPGRHRYVCLVM